MVITRTGKDTRTAMESDSNSEESAFLNFEMDN